jgi:hypothetical protein
MRRKSKFGTSLVSISSRMRAWSPACTLGSVLMTCRTSCETRLTSASGRFLRERGQREERARAQQDARRNVSE